ncbi:hypothetical protein Vretifemale_15270, partial [Volvox reticuliferus]
TFWGTARERTGPGICTFLKSQDSHNIFQVRRVIIEDGSYTDLVRIDEDGLERAASQAAMGVLHLPSSSSWHQRADEHTAAATDIRNTCEPDEYDGSGYNDSIDNDAGGECSVGEREFAGGSLLARVRELADITWPLTSKDVVINEERMIRRVVAVQLAKVGAFSHDMSCLMSKVGSWVHRNMYWRNDQAAAGDVRNLGVILRDKESRGVFLLCRNEWKNANALYLDFRMLQTAARANGYSSGGASDAPIERQCAVRLVCPTRRALAEDDRLIAQDTQQRHLDQEAWSHDFQPRPRPQLHAE